MEHQQVFQQASETVNLKIKKEKVIIKSKSDKNVFVEIKRSIW